MVPIIELIVVAPVLVPMLVIVPALLTVAVENKMVPEPPVLFIVKLLLPVTPPEKVKAAILPLLPIVRMPVVLEASAIGFAYVSR